MVRRPEIHGCQGAYRERRREHRAVLLVGVEVMTIDGTSRRRCASSRSSPAKPPTAVQGCSGYHAPPARMLGLPFCPRAARTLAARPSEAACRTHLGQRARVQARPSSVSPVAARPTHPASAVGWRKVDPNVLHGGAARSQAGPGGGSRLHLGGLGDRGRDPRRRCRSSACGWGRVR